MSIRLSYAISTSNYFGVLGNLPDSQIERNTKTFQKVYAPKEDPVIKSLKRKTIQPISNQPTGGLLGTIKTAFFLYLAAFANASPTRTMIPCEGNYCVASATQSFFSMTPRYETPLQNLEKLSIKELSELDTRLKDYEAKVSAILQDRINRIKEAYGNLFIETVGLKNIINLPFIEATELGLDKEVKYHYGVRPSQLGKHSAVQGIDGFNRPFIAIKLVTTNEKGQREEWCELIFKRYSLDGDGKKGRLHENNYVSALHALSDKGEEIPVMNESGGMSEELMTVVRDLLEGKTVSSRGRFVSMPKEPDLF